MNEFLPFVVSGIATGSIFGLASTGLVLTYKTSGILNFGHGAIATIAAYLFYYLHIDLGLSWVPSLVICVFIAGPILGVAIEPLARRLAQRRPADRIVGTVGLILLVQGLGSILYGSDTTLVGQYLPGATDYFRVAGVNVSYPQLWVTLIGVIAALAIFGSMRYTKLGLAMRAVVDDPDLLAMQARSPVAVRRQSWVLGCTLAAASGVLVLPFLGLNGIALTFLVVQSFGAAAIGAFSNIPLTYVGGIVIGILAALSQKWAIENQLLAGLPDSIPFMVLFAALLVLPKRKLSPPAAPEPPAQARYRAPALARVLTGIVILIPIALVPQLVGAVMLPYYTIGLTQVLILLSLGLLVRTSGQVSLCHAAFAAIGAVAFSQFAVDHHIPWFLAVVLAGLVVVPVGAVVAIPAIRLSGVFLALATFGFGILVQDLLYGTSFMFTASANGRAMVRPGFAQTDTAYYYLVLAFVVVASLLVTLIIQSRLGRLLRGLSESPVAVATMGLSTNQTRLIVFGISAFLAGIGGVLYGSSINFATAGDTHFTAFQSLVLLAVLALAPFDEPWYAIFMAAASVIPGYLTSTHTNDWMNVIFGFFAIQVAVQARRPQVPALLQSVLERFRRPAPAIAPVIDPAGGGPAPSAVAVQAVRGEGRGLEVDNLNVRFGGLQAVRGLTFRAPLGQITGLIGPNGAGKTTTFDACSGLNRRLGGKISLNGYDITRLDPAARGRRGLGRTFQRMQLGDSLTVLDNVALGPETRMAGGNVFSQLFASPNARRETYRRAREALELCGIAGLAQVRAGSLSTGQRRLVELARCFAGSFDFLLLDEPSSGLDPNETDEFDEVLQSVVRERGCGVLLVEHDVSLVLRLCRYIYVMDFGELIFEGDPAAVAKSPIVQAAYLGSTEVIAQSAGQGTQGVTL